jgi:hypothetical protein
VIQKDVILRQVQQLAQALAMILFNKKERRPDLAEDSMTRALRDVFGSDLADLQTFTREEIVALCSPGDVWSAELALALADLLREDDAPESHERSAWLYETALAAGDLVPMDIHDRIEALRTPAP